MTGLALCLRPDDRISGLTDERGGDRYERRHTNVPSLANRRASHASLEPGRPGRTRLRCVPAAVSLHLSAIYASYADDLGMKANAALQCMYLGDRYRQVFEGTRIADVGLTQQLEQERADVARARRR